jgi:Phage integrase, N-terminal SAM-like domain
MDHPAAPRSLLRSFERHLRAQNRSERTVGNYLESARLADAFLEGRGKRLEQATQADLEDFVAHILRRRSASTNALACRRGSTRANRPATRAGNSSSPTCQQAGDTQGGPAAPRASPGSRCASPIPVAWSGGWRRLAGLSRGRDGPPLVHSSSPLLAAFSAPSPPAAGLG